MPFPVRVRACNADFEPVPTDRVVARITSTDDTATLPPAQPLRDGELVVEVTLNTAGTFTVSAQDIIGPEYYTVTSRDVVVSGSTGIATALQIDDLGPLQTAGMPADRDHPGRGRRRRPGARLRRRGGPRPGSQRGHPELRTPARHPGRRRLDRVGDLPSGGSGDAPARHAAARTTPCEGSAIPFAVAAGPLSRLLIVAPGQRAAPASVAGLTGWPAPQAAGRAFSVEIFATDTFWNRVDVGHVPSG